MMIFHFLRLLTPFSPKVFRQTRTQTKASRLTNTKQAGRLTEGQVIRKVGMQTDRQTSWRRKDMHVLSQALRKAKRKQTNTETEIQQTKAKITVILWHPSNLFQL